MALSLPICDVCMTDNKNKFAIVWCSECEETICNDCEKQHGRMRLTKKHITTPIQDYQQMPSSVAAIKKICTGHSLKFEFFCVMHNQPCCVSCISEKHCNCQKIKPLSEVVAGVKSSAAFGDLEDRVKDINKLIGNLVTEKQDGQASFVAQKNKIKAEVQNVRTAINNHLDKLQKDILDKLGNEEKKHNGHVSMFIEKLSEMRRNVVNISIDLENAKQYASNFQAFLGIHEWNQKIEVEEKDWMSLQTDQKMNTFNIEIEFSPTLMKIEKDVKEFGKLEVKSSSSKKILLKKEKQGQIVVPASNTVSYMTLKTVRSFQTPAGRSSYMFITGIDVFDDGRFVLADNHPSNNRLVIMNQECEFIRTIEFESRCLDVAVIGKNTVATTLFDMKEIVINDVNSSKGQRSISTSDKCCGINYNGEQLVVSLYNSTIQFLDLSGNILSTLSTANHSIYCSVFNNTLFYTTHNSDVVYSTELKGKVLWKFDCRKSDSPLGITNDASGNIFVACCNSNQLMVVGHDGKESRILLTKGDGLQEPRAIHYNSKSKTLLVCNMSGKCFLYRVT